MFAVMREQEKPGASQRRTDRHGESLAFLLSVIRGYRHQCSPKAAVTPLSNRCISVPHPGSQCASLSLNRNPIERVKEVGLTPSSPSQFSAIFESRS
jgi:hypothetical protein